MAAYNYLKGLGSYGQPRPPRPQSLPAGVRPGQRAGTPTYGTGGSDFRQAPPGYGIPPQASPVGPPQGTPPGMPPTAFPKPIENGFIAQLPPWGQGVPDAATQQMLLSQLGNNYGLPIGHAGRQPPMLPGGGTVDWKTLWRMLQQQQGKPGYAAY